MGLVFWPAYIWTRRKTTRMPDIRADHSPRTLAMQQNQGIAMSADRPPPPPTETPAALPPAGWHPDPGQPDRQRYWDGAAWTDHYHPPLPPAALQKNHGQLIWAGYVLAIVVPLIGFIIGIVLLTKDKATHGLLIMGLSVLTVVVLASALSGG